MADVVPPTVLPPVDVTADPGTGNEGLPNPSAGTGGFSLTTVPVTQPAGVQRTYGQSRYYLVVIYSSIHGIVEAWLPDDVMLNVSSNWGYIVSQIDNPVANWLVGAASLAATGEIKGLKSQYLSNMAWRGSSPLQLQLSLHFFAESDSNLEVIEPIKRLIKMALPRRGSDSSRLIPPGPFAFSSSIIDISDNVRKFFGQAPLDTALSTDHITIYIGNYLRMTEVFIASINQVTFPAKLSQEGFPMEGKIVINVSTLMAPVAQDIDRILGTFVPSLDTPFPPQPVGTNPGG